MIFVTTLITSGCSEVICGVSRTLNDATNLIKILSPEGSRFSIASQTPTRIILRGESGRLFMIRIMDRDIEGDTAYVITKKRSDNTENMWCIYDNIDKANKYIEENLISESRRHLDKCHITEISGISPLSKVMKKDSDQVTFVLYEVKI